jgi:pre-mRNA-splicing factor SYF2
MSSDDRQQRKEKLEQLRQKIKETEQLNREDIQKEEQRKSITNAEIQKAKNKQKKAQEELERLEAEKNEEDYDRLRRLKYTAEEHEEWNKREQKKRQNEEETKKGLGGWDEANLKKHKKLVKDLKPNLEAYQRQKAEHGGVYHDANSLEYGTDSKPSAAALERMQKDLFKQLESRDKRSKRRKLGPEEDIMHVNDANRRFNDKLQR